MIFPKLIYSKINKNIVLFGYDTDIFVLLFFFRLIRRFKSPRQLGGYKRISTGNISKRPASISKMYTHLLKVDAAPKLQAGPYFARPGPILLKVPSTEEKLHRSLRGVL